MTDFVLVHGAFHGGWCWDALAERLVARGHRVFAPTLAGCAERADEDHAPISLETHIAEITALIIEHGLREIVLVGHSLGGMVVTAVADRCRDAIAQLVYLDAFVPSSGEAARDYIPGELYEPALQAVHRLGRRTSLPVIFPPAKFVRLEGAERDAFMARLTPHPFLCFVEPVFLAHPPVVHRTFLFCEGIPFGLFDHFAEAARTDSAWHYHSLPTAHDAMIEAPGLLADLLTVN
ncbi:alpha/beta fold hydrolase [Novosphingobium sp.]|uniref:alpha/beta fold hydrolase n=1 Tax=Novosphingobium sp. TaxID=1874826 RepID=UPI001D2EC8CD|nr:alpha/beta fold hydrolase [Novosphingobium sp.]MBX9663675.1 alpha/beta fold hydrolase [Novosphingobium sp.]